jgi:hypothetical protein
MSSKRQTLSEEDVDELVTALADDDAAWEESIKVSRHRPSSDARPSTLTALWHKSRHHLANKHIQQIIAFAGEGKLRDGSPTSAEFREFLSHVPSDTLQRYAEECLSDSFPDSGFALQDIINQVGKRLGFQVAEGRYQGTRASVGHDGLWTFPSGHSVVLEVKTTDAYRINSDKIADYRKRLIALKEVEEGKSSILVVVGRQDTGDLEAQIRGSRHAWDVRLISVDALFRLMRSKEAVDDPQVIERICSILVPREYTRLDDIIEIVFFATEEAKQEESIGEEEADANNIEASERGKKPAPPVAFHDACIERFSSEFDITLVRRTRTSYTTPDRGMAVVCSVSKAHERQSHIFYWFAFHPYQKDFLESSNKSFLVLGCGSKDNVLSIPYPEFKPWLDDLWTTERDARMYWHIRIQKEKAKFYLDRKRGIGRLDISRYLLLRGK